MKRIGITGQSGFIGKHLHNFLSQKPDIELIDFQDEFFQSETKLRKFVGKCDTIIHLAAVNRDNDPERLKNTNIELSKKLISAMDTEEVSPHVLFSSSIQEEYGTPYGDAKKISRNLLGEWAKTNNTSFTGLIIPNVFGPFGLPYYNSVVATFCHQLLIDEEPVIMDDKDLKLIYIHELVEVIWDSIMTERNNEGYEIPWSISILVSELLNKLKIYKSQYNDQGIFPKLETVFEINLFNTFRSFIDPERFFPVLIKKHTDERGSFVETTKTEIGGQFSFSTTKPGITRGNHFHTRKIERFIVIKGNARISLRRIGDDKIHSFEIEGNSPAYVDMPVWYTHNITNIGDEDLVTLFWINEFFNSEDPDTYFETV